MPDYLCPNCRGGFDQPHRREDDDGNLHSECPWCEQAMDGSYEYEPRVRSIARTEENDDDQEGGRLARFFR